MSAVDFTRVAFTPLARAPSWPPQTAVKGVRLHVTSKPSGGVVLRFTIGQDAQGALAALENDRVVLNFAHHPAHEEFMVMLRRGGTGRRSGSMLRRHNASPSLTVTFHASRLQLTRLTVIEPRWCAHPDGGLVVFFSGEAATTLRAFQQTAALVANGVRERIDARLAEGAR